MEFRTEISCFGRFLYLNFGFSEFLDLSKSEIIGVIRNTVILGFELMD